MIVSDDGAIAASPASRMHSVPAIATLSTDANTPTPDPPGPVGALPPQAIENEPSNAIVNDMQAMTLEVLNDSAALSARNADLQEVVAGLRSKIQELEAQNGAARTLMDTLNARITAQDADLRTLQGLETEVKRLQQQVKVLQEESATRDEHLRRAQEQLVQQERSTNLLQDAYNAIRLRISVPPQSMSSPFANSMYLANPVFGNGQSMMPVTMGQMQAMEGLYFNLPSSVANSAAGSNIGGAGVGPSVSNMAGSSRVGRDGMGGMASGVSRQQ